MSHRSAQSHRPAGAESSLAPSPLATPLENLERIWMPKLWHGMSWRAWTRMLVRHGFAVAPRRWPLAAMVTLFAAGNSLARLVQRPLYARRLARTQLAAPPVFIVGHWRSGTTWLHELLSADPRHTAPTTFECFAPCSFLLTERFVVRWLRFLLPARRIPDRMAQSWESPQEDEPALCHLGQPSPYWKLAFPNLPQQAPFEVEAWGGPAAAEEWLATLGRFLREISLLRPRRIVLKCPLHAFRIGLLAAGFPGSRFVYIVRDPERVIPSTIHLWRVMRASQGLQVARHEGLVDEVFETFHALDAAVVRARESLPRSAMAVVRYEDLRSDPRVTLSSIYAELELGDVQPLLDAVDQSLEASYTANRYCIDEGLRQRIDQECQSYRERYGYAAAGSPAILSPHSRPTYRT